MQIAITGATGGLGRNLCHYYLDKGYSVRALGRNIKIGQSLQKQGCQFFPGDIRDRSYLAKSLSGVDVVVHAAALASHWGNWKDFHAINIVGTQNVVSVAEGLNLRRFVNISTPSIYFSGQHQQNTLETEVPGEIHGFYAQSKYRAEKIAWESFQRSQLPLITLRPRALYGPWDQVILPRVLRVMERGYFLLPGGGQSLTDITYVGNVVHAIDLCIVSDERCLGEVYNITDDEPITVISLVQKIANFLENGVTPLHAPKVLLSTLARCLETVARLSHQKEPMLTSQSVALLGTTQTLSIEKAKKDLGYRALTNIDQGLQQYFQWRENYELH